jgi:hypothetical protein
MRCYYSMSNSSSNSSQVIIKLMNFDSWVLPAVIAAKLGPTARLLAARGQCPLVRVHDERPTTSPRYRRENPLGERHEEK